jgi:hypothetical protein
MIEVFLKSVVLPVQQEVLLESECLPGRLLSWIHQV